MPWWSQLTRESAPSCHDEEACSRVRHGYDALEMMCCAASKFLLILYDGMIQNEVVKQFDTSIKYNNTRDVYFYIYSVSAYMG